MDNKNIEIYSIESKKFIKPVLISLAFIIGLGIGIVVSSVVRFPGINSLNTTNTDQQLSSSSFYDQEVLDDIYQTIDQRYINELPQKSDITYGMIKGLIESLDDKYTSFLTPDEAKEYVEARNPDFQGIGVTLSFEANNTVVETVLSGNPAEKAGFLKGDVIVEVDGVNLEGEFPSVVASKIRGEKGTTVSIKIFRESTGEVLELKAIRDTIQVTNVSYKYLEDGIYRININQFVDESAQEFNKTWDDTVNEISTSDKPVKSIILDLRNNPGGYVYSVRHVLEEFLKNDEVLMMEEKKNSDRVVYKDTRTGKFEDVKLVVLVNEGSASASEILATAIQDNERGEVIGKPTVGKGVEQEVLDDFKDGSILILVFQKWLSPDGRFLTSENPVKPDIDVDYTMDDFKSGNDKQLERAKEEVRK